MFFLIIKIFITATLIVSISEIENLMTDWVEL